MAAIVRSVSSICSLRNLFSRLSVHSAKHVPAQSLSPWFLSSQRNYHLTSVNSKNKWEGYNKIIYPPTKPGEPERPAEITHVRKNIKYSPLKLWYIACMIRGMTIDEALKQLSFYKRKGAVAVKEVLLEAQEMAVNEHGVEFKSNLWISEANSVKGVVVKGLRKHRGPRYGIVHYKYSHFYVRLREGSPPKHYYPPQMTGNEKLHEYLENQRSRRIVFSL
ncbi:RP-L22 [Acanthosepion pharaonis]|uniref:Large ribosomal subunit protein uL22m n=1 Tax=Acanthosepion pharaonis TaxID=158019 RepID=A0A812BQX7_ACAPH|nr:RP-L22 [Sepia pharaonis]